MENEEKDLNEEGLGDIIKERDKALTETLKEQQNPPDPNTVEKELEERAKKKELKKKLTNEIKGNTRGSTSFSDPLRFQKQLTEFNKMIPEPTIQDLSETFADFKVGSMGGSLIADYVPLPRGVLPVLTGTAAATVGKFKDHIIKAIDDTGITQPFKIAFRGDLIGAVADGTGTSGGTQAYQLVTQFPWEYNSKSVARPKANYGDTISITNRKVPRGRTNRMTTRTLNQFTKVEELDLSNGFIPTKQHANFREYIEDLIEADKIPAQNISPTLFKAKVYKKTPDLELYEDYLSGYFNTYDTLEGATKVTLGPSAVTGKTKYFFPAADIPEVDRIMKIFKLNPEAFRNATASAGVINNKQFLQDITQYTDLDDFLAKQFKFQGHHLLIIDDSFALIKGLNAKDTITMRNYMKSIDLKLGNDPENIKFIPQQLHQKFMHGKIWKEYGPNWVGTTDFARQKQLAISKLPVEERFKLADELKESLDLTNVIADRAVENYIISKGTNVPPTKKQWDDYMGELITDDLLNLPPTGTAKESGFDKLGGGQDLRPATEIESDVFGQGQMQDDL